MTTKAHSRWLERLLEEISTKVPLNEWEINQLWLAGLKNSKNPHLYEITDDLFCDKVQTDTPYSFQRDTIF